MILIDEYADSKLLRTLEDLRVQPSTTTTRLIHLKLAGPRGSNDSAQSLHDTVIAAIQRMLPDASPNIYLCEDGDIFILAPATAHKDAKQLLFDLAVQLHCAPTDDFAEIYELNVHIHKPLLLLEQKLEIHRKTAESIWLQQTTEQAQRKRRAILHHDVPRDRTHDIAARRRARSKPELMMIEDDAFSRRLVENVLQKHYSLTALGVADHAISIYAGLAPDVLFLDIGLPDVTGHELLERLVAIDPEAYIIMLSGHSDQANIVQAIKNGAKGFIAKPFTRDKLFQYIERRPTHH